MPIDLLDVASEIRVSEYTPPARTRSKVENHEYSGLVFVRNKGNIVDVSENATICGSKLRMCAWIQSREKRPRIPARCTFPTLTICFINLRMSQLLFAVVFNEIIEIVGWGGGGRE